MAAEVWAASTVAVTCLVGKGASTENSLMMAAVLHRSAASGYVYPSYLV